MLIPPLISHLDEGAIVPLLLEGGFDVIGAVGERIAALTLVRLQIAAHHERDAVAERLDGTRVVEIGAPFPIGCGQQLREAFTLVEVQGPGDEIHRRARAVRPQDGGTAALQRFNAIDGDVVLEILIVAAAAVENRQAVFLQADEALAAAGQPAYGVIIRDRTGGALHEHARNQLQHVRGTARRLLLDLRRVDGCHIHGGIEHRSL